MQVLALGKWSKADRSWKMVVSMRRQTGPVRDTADTHRERGAAVTRRPDPKGDNR